MQRLTWLALLLFSALGVCAELPPTDALLRSGQQFHEFVENATLSAAFSGCGLCQQTGQCDHAFRGQPGQFCIGMASGAPCCCPRDAQCAASPYECRCRRVVPTAHYGGDDYHPSSHSSGISSTFVFFALLLTCCVCCCYLPARRAQQARDEQFAYAQPVATSQYGTYPGQQSQAPYAYASAPVAYESSPYRESGGGGNSLAAGALGALGGLGAGAALGSMFGGRNNSGDTGGMSDNTYTFSGDTGGGDFGGDFGGDGGDDGTFAGDS
ncbi:hypothetical protein PRIC1_005892 [Phytophthora ramorum]|uniref:Uncharacterized protein n=1 Tax=Phytophthora ramorum TaxID=164328 RepID=H3H0V2_PHYRM|nr:hypothetical protein KRP23_13896 [Phytophthora ramorum]